MCLALAVGRGDTPLARLDGDRPLVRPDDVVLLGRSDGDGEQWYGEDALAVLPILDLRRSGLRKRGAVRTAEVALERVSMPELDGFWIHLDADVLEATIMPAVDSPEAGGLTLEELSALLTPLVRHPRALGLEVTIYDPGLDPDRRSAGRLAGLLEQALTSDSCR
jgi:arginase